MHRHASHHDGATIQDPRPTARGTQAVAIEHHTIEHPPHHTSNGAGRPAGVLRPLHHLPDVRDGDGVAACFEYPTLMVMSDHKYGPNLPFDGEDTASAFFANDAEMYRQRGIWGTFADVRDVQWLTPDLCLVNAHFPYIDADGNDMGDGESSLYIVRRTTGGYAIAAIVTLGTESDHAGRQPR